MFCMECGAENAKEAKFCSKCGKSLTNQDSPKVQPTPAVAQKQGIVKKCPSCGAALGAFATSCTDCGHELSDIEASRTIKALFEKFEAIEKETEADGARNSKRRIQSIQNKRAAAIRDFPVPNAREELQQLIYFIQPKIVESAKAESADPNIDDWKVKFAEVLGRARNAYKSDPKMLTELDRIESSLKTTVSSTLIVKVKRNPIKTALASILVVAMVGGAISEQERKAKLLACEIKHDSAVASEKGRLNLLLANVNKEMLDKNLTIAMAHSAQIKWEYTDECKTEETIQLKTAWDEKRSEVSVVIQKHIDAEIAAKKEAEDRIAIERQAIADREANERQATANRVANERQAHTNLQAERERTEAQKSQATMNAVGNILGTIFRK
jgi:ribosomal protein L40E